ncbi:MAG: hypothetical protein AAB263_08570, partial [Planctomycetota bacterium]
MGEPLKDPAGRWKDGIQSYFQRSADSQCMIGSYGLNAGFDSLEPAPAYARFFAKLRLGKLGFPSKLADSVFHDQLSLHDTSTGFSENWMIRSRSTISNKREKRATTLAGMNDHSPPHATVHKPRLVHRAHPITTIIILHMTVSVD